MWPRRDASKQRNEAIVEAQAERLLADERFPALRTRNGRRWLSVVQTLVIIAIPFAWLAGGQLIGLAAVVVGLVVLWLMRLSVRVVADLPDHLLDERLLRSRDAAYVDAFRYFAAMLVILASLGLLAFMINADDADAWSVTLTWESVMAGFWTLIITALALPSMTLAARAGTEVQVDPDE